MTPLDPGQGGARDGEQIHLHGDDDFALDDQVGLEGEGVERCVDGPLDRILEREDPEVDVARGHGLDDIGDRQEVDEFRRGQVGLRQQRLLGERPRRSEVADPPDPRCCIHDSRDYEAVPTAGGTQSRP